MKCVLVGSRYASPKIVPGEAIPQGSELIHTEIAGAKGLGKPTFKVMAHLLVPKALPSDALRGGLERLASEMMLDIALGERRAA